MGLYEVLDNPQKALSVIALIAIIGIVAMGITGYFVTAKSIDIVSAVTKTLTDLLIAAGGAKAGLAIPQSGKRDDVEPKK